MMDHEKLKMKFKKLERMDNFNEKNEDVDVPKLLNDKEVLKKSLSAA